MLRLPDALKAWGTPDFADVLKRELARNAAELPLQQGLSISNYVVDAPVTVMIHSVDEAKNAIRVKAGIFYKGIVAGCACEGDPTPAPENTEYCVVLLEIDKTTAEARATLVAE